MIVVGIAGFKNSGKTTLVERIVAEAAGRGLNVATLKHAHHGFDIDQPGTDSHRHRAAGARQVLIASDRRIALMEELGDQPGPDLDALLRRLGPADLVVVEGWKSAALPKIEVFRPETGAALMAEQDGHIIAVVSDDAPQTAKPVFAASAVTDVVDFILHNVLPWEGDHDA